MNDQQLSDDEASDLLKELRSEHDHHGETDTDDQDEP